MLRVDALTVRYDEAEAVTAVDLHVDEGEIVTLLGPNGAGKSTLLRTIAGLQRPYAGTVHFDGEDVKSTAAHRRARQGLVLVPEGRHIFSRLTVEENLLLGAWGRRSITGEIERIHALFPILHERRRLPAMALSGGEQQLLAIGRALMRRPRMLLLDEPSLGLSPVAVEQVFRVIGEIHDAGISVLLVEQDTNRALDIADRGYMLGGGRIVFDGPTDELRDEEVLRRAYLGSVK